jgi:hypothetical protein
LRAVKPDRGLKCEKEVVTPVRYLEIMAWFLQYRWN